MKLVPLIRGLIATTLLALSSMAYAGFPDDFSDVIWIDPDISGFPITSNISANVNGSILAVQGTQRSVWPRKFHSVLQNDCCNRSLWIFIKLDSQWYATTFEYMRVGQINKKAEAVRGRQIKRAPFNRSGYEWHPADGEVYGFMTSGMARFDLVNLNVSERSNIALYRWGVGPTSNADFNEVPRDDNGFPVEDGVTPAPECVEPPAQEAENNTHMYNGRADGRLVVTGNFSVIQDYSEGIDITVKDDRSISIVIDGDEVLLSSTVAADGSYSGVYTRSVISGCDVDVTIQGVVNGDKTSGTATGNETCFGTTAILSATYIATSITQPSFLDQRPEPTPARRVCPFNLTIAPAVNLLLNDD